MVEAQNLRGGYGGADVVRDVSLRFEDGCLSTVIGPNGCGKSTLLQLLCGLLRPTGGEVRVDGADLRTLKRTELARRISYLPQVHPAASIRVRSLVAHGRFPYLGYPRRYTAQDEAKIDEAMEFAEVRDLADRMLGELSGGQQQRAYIAMLLAQDTRTVLLDEPTTFLDIRHQLDLIELARRLTGLGKAVVMVSHDVNSALCSSDRLAVMERGAVSAFGTPRQVYESGAVDRAFGVRVVYVPEQGQYLCRRQ